MLPSLSVTCPGFIHVAACQGVIPPWCGWTPFCWSVHLLVDTWLVSSLRRLWVFTHKPVDSFPVLLGSHLGHVGPLFRVERNEPTERQVFSMWTPTSQPAGRVGGSAPLPSCDVWSWLSWWM